MTTLQHTPDMLYALSERLCMKALEEPLVFSSAYTSIKQLIQKEEFPAVKRMTQAEKILFLLRKGHTLTNKSLLINHKISAPWKRISELRAKGHEIDGTWRTCPLDGSQYIVYSMADQKAAA